MLSRLKTHFNLIAIASLVFLCILVYFNMLHGQFSFIDDNSGFARNRELADFWTIFKSLYLQAIIFSASYNIFGIVPEPLHIHSLILHIANILLIYFVLSELFGRKIAFLAAALAAVHPINTEAVSWISGRIYLYHGFSMYLLMWLYIQFKKTENRNYLFSAGIVLLFTAVFIRGFWVINSVLAVTVLEVIFYSKGRIKPFMLKLLGVAGAIVLVTIILLYPQISARIATMQTLEYVNQQALTPVIQSYPYTISTMVRLYLFPKDLTVYYDGNPLTRYDYISMYTVMIVYCAAIVYLWRKNLKYAGILILLPILIAQAFSPLPVSWYMAERYLYFGTPFAMALIVSVLFDAEKKVKLKYATFTLVSILIILLGYRTILRNIDWQSPYNLAVSSIKTSPATPRPYIDMGSVYYLKGDFVTARKYYLKALEISPKSANAKSSLGQLYMVRGVPDDLYTNAANPPDHAQAEQAFNTAVAVYSDSTINDSIYFLIEAIHYDPTFYQAQDSLGDMFTKTMHFDYARKQYLKCLELNPKSDMAYMKLGFVEWQMKNFDKARDYEAKALTLNPDNKDAQQLVQRINESEKLLSK